MGIFNIIITSLLTIKNIRTFLITSAFIFSSYVMYQMRIFEERFISLNQYQEQNIIFEISKRANKKVAGKDLNADSQRQARNTCRDMFRENSYLLNFYSTEGVKLQESCKILLEHPIIE